MSTPTAQTGSIDWGLGDYEATAAELAPGIRYDKMVEALGGYGELVERPEDIRPALERAFASGLPACVNVLIDPNKPYSRSTNVAV